MKVILLISVLFLFSCEGIELEHKVIMTKSHNIYGGNDPMPDGLCRYSYRATQNGGWIEFTDSCSSYGVGDTLGKK